MMGSNFAFGDCASENFLTVALLEQLEQTECDDAAPVDASAPPLPCKGRGVTGALEQRRTVGAPVGQNEWSRMGSGAHANS